MPSAKAAKGIKILHKDGYANRAMMDGPPRLHSFGMQLKDICVSPIYHFKVIAQLHNNYFCVDIKFTLRR